MKKVLFVIYGDLEIGGIQNVVMNIARHLHHKYTFDAVVTSDNRGNNAKEFLSYGGRIFCIPCCINDTSLRGRVDYYIRGNRIYRSFLRILKDEGPYDVVHSNFAEETGIFLQAAKRMNVPIRIYHRHGMNENQKKVNIIREAYYNVLSKKAIQNATDLLGCSNAVCEEWFKGKEYSVLYNMIDKQYIRALDKNIEPLPYSFVHVGRACSTKNQLFALEVFSKFQKKHPEAVFTFVGMDASEYSNQLKRRADELSLGVSVVFVDTTHDVIKYYLNSRYMIFPSSFEGFGLAILEAQACGIYCFVSDQVTKEVDVGLCDFISMKSGADAWADEIERKILNGYDTHKSIPNLSKFLPDTISHQYDMLYSGKLRE